MDLSDQDKGDTKCLMFIPAKYGLITSAFLNMVIIFMGSVALMRGDIASLYGFPQEEVDKVTKDMEKPSDQYTLWVFMQSEIWIGYVLLCSINMICLIRMILKDSYSSRMCAARSIAFTAIFSFWNVAMALCGFHYLPPEVVLCIIYIYLFHVGYYYAMELKKYSSESSGSSHSSSSSHHSDLEALIG